MSTRANIIIKDSYTTLYFYRHSDGYPECTGEDLKSFVKDYTQGSMRLDAMQSSGWLILRGHLEYNPKSKWLPTKVGFDGWKVGAYEPTSELHGDVDYVYVIDLETQTLLCAQPKGNFGNEPSLKNTKLCKEFGVIDFSSNQKTIALFAVESEGGAK